MTVPRGKRPRTALLTAAIWRRDGYKQCRTCKVMKSPDDYYKHNAVCKVCYSAKKAAKQRGTYQEIVRVSVPGWGCRT
jgi:hypothetical protein